MSGNLNDNGVTMTGDASEDAQARLLREKMTELRGKKHLPADLLEVVGGVAELHLAARDAVSFGASGRELPPEILEKAPPADARAQGRPFLRPVDFPLDMRQASELGEGILDVLAAAVPRLGSDIQNLKYRLKNEPKLLALVCQAAAAEFSQEENEAGSPESGASCLSAWASDHPAAPGLLRFVARSATAPAISLAAEILGKEHNREAAWGHGHCPICGSPPLMGRLVGNEGARLHSCSFCSFEYRVPRTECPFCLETLAKGADYYVSPEEPGYSIAACPECRNYIKLADRRSGEGLRLPMLDDLASLALDIYAHEQHYTRPTLSAWGF